MDNTKIGWTDDTRNLWWGCVSANAQCDHCYADAFDRRLGGNHWGARAPRLAQPGVWEALRKAQQTAFAARTFRTQFVQSMGDIFERSMPLVNKRGESIVGSTGDLRNRFFTEVVPNSPNLIFLLLTKRPQNIARMVPEAWLVTPPPNVWYGCSVGVGNRVLDQNNIDALLDVPGRHFLSAEPLLGPLVANFYGVEWVITGGESGPKAREAKMEWFADIRERCVELGIAFFMKQMGSHLAKSLHCQDSKGETMAEWPEDLRIQQFPAWGLG